MVSLWPWKAKKDDSASFEKTLSALSTKIQKANIAKDSLYTRSRRYRVLWTLYTTLAYLLSALILVLVTGWQNWGPVEYTIVAAGPVVIYVVRAALVAFYDYRISSAQASLDDLQQQRETAIESFKAATNYTSTHQLLEKYGAATPNSSPPQKGQSSSSRKSKSSSGTSASQNAHQQQDHPPQQRTGIPPPPTANISRPASNLQPQPPSPRPQPSPPSPPSPQADFAPNAFPPGTLPAPQYAREGSTSGVVAPQWYDRILDLLLGEDETKSVNRLALICQHCKLVNGLAPPGIKNLHDLGRWRCAACRGWNGEETEVRKIVRLAEASAARNGVGDAEAEAEVELVPKRDILNEKEKIARGNAANPLDGEYADDENDEEDDEGSLTPLDDDEDGNDEEVEVNEPPARSTRSKAASAAKDAG